MTLKINFKLFIIFFNVEGPPCATVVAFYKKSDKRDCKN